MGDDPTAIPVCIDNDGNGFIDCAAHRCRPPSATVNTGCL
jgi:hypothetical protein